MDRCCQVLSKPLESLKPRLKNWALISRLIFFSIRVKVRSDIKQQKVGPLKKKFFLLEGGKKSILHISLQGNQDFFSFKTKPRVEAAAYFLQLKKISFISTWDFLRGMKQSYQKLKMASNSSHSFLSDTSFLVHSV